MKFVIKIVFLIVSLCSCEGFAIKSEEEKELILSILSVCKEKEKGNQEDVDIIVSMKTPTSKEGKCMLACVLETAGIVS
jgi:hypothetical protein